jgi:L-fuculose-phosphate aldolase
MKQNLSERQTMNYRQIREQVYETVIKIQDAGLTRLSAGNVSARTEDGLVAITPTAVKYDTMSPQDIAIVDLQGKPVDAPRKPSSETPMHTAILRHFPAVNAICHTHSPHAIAFSMAAEEVPVANIELLLCGAPIPVARWACPGTTGGADVAVEIFSQRPGLKVFLLRKHGLVAIGDSLSQAFEFAYDAEVGMQAYYYALSIGKPTPLTPEQVAEVQRRYA